MELAYRQEGDYLIPNLTVEEHRGGKLGMFGRMREKYLKEEHGILYMQLKVQVKLREHLLEIDREAEEMQERIIRQMAKQRGVTEQMKADNQMHWVQEMNNIRASARETVLHDLIYV